MARYTIMLRETLRGWEWALAGRHPLSSVSWNGFYHSEGRARGAAKMSLRRTFVGHPQPLNFEFVTQPKETP